MTDLFDFKSIFNNLVSNAVWVVLAFFVGTILLIVKRRWKKAGSDEIDLNKVSDTIEEKPQSKRESPSTEEGSIRFALSKKDSARLAGFLNARTIKDTTLILDDIKALFIKPKDGPEYEEKKPVRLEVTHGLPKDEYFDILIDGQKVFDVSLRFSFTLIDRSSQKFVIENKKQSFPLRFKLEQSLSLRTLTYKHTYESDEEFTIDDCLMAHRYALKFLTGKQLVFRTKGVPDLEINLVKVRNEFKSSETYFNYTKQAIEAFEKLQTIANSFLAKRHQTFPMFLESSEISSIFFLHEYLQHNELRLDDARVVVYLRKDTQNARNMLRHKTAANLRISETNLKIRHPFLGGELAYNGRKILFLKARVKFRRFAILRHWAFFWQKTTPVQIVSVGKGSVLIRYDEIRYQQ